MTIQEAIDKYDFKIIIENGQEMLKAQAIITSTTPKDVIFLKTSKQAIISQIKQNEIDEAEAAQAKKANLGYVASVSETKLQTRNDAGEWVDASTITRDLEKDPVKPWHGDAQNVEEAKEMLKVWGTPEMKAKAREAAAHHDAVHGDDSDDYDDD